MAKKIYTPKVTKLKDIPLIGKLSKSAGIQPNGFKLAKSNYKLKEPINGFESLINRPFSMPIEIPSGALVNVFKNKDGDYFAYTEYSEDGHDLVIVSKKYSDKKVEPNNQFVLPSNFKTTKKELIDTLENHNWFYKVTDASNTYRKGAEEVEYIKNAIAYLNQTGKLDIKKSTRMIKSYFNKRNPVGTEYTEYLPY